jgi:hypothetical protein
MNWNKKPTKTCKLCPKVAIAGEKYCKDCRKEVLSQMKASGYLDDGPASTMIFNDAKGRKSRSTETLGGAAEMQSDGDEW